MGVFGGAWHYSLQKRSHDWLIAQIQGAQRQTLVASLLQPSLRHTLHPPPISSLNPRPNRGVNLEVSGPYLDGYPGEGNQHRRLRSNMHHIHIQHAWV